jgi:hypothetical protein
MSDLLEAAEPFDVEMDDLAGMGAFVAARRFGWLQGRRRVEAQPAQKAAHCVWRDADLGGRSACCGAGGRKASMAAHVAAGVWLGNEWGFDERSRR